MLRVFTCPKCKKSRLVSKFLTAQCYECGENMTLCRVPYEKWVNMSLKEREEELKRYYR